MSFGKRISLRLFALFACAVAFPNSRPVEAQVPVQHKEGLVHGFLVLRTLEGETLADGDLIQNAAGDRVTTRLIFHFKDGSVHDETVVFSQRGSFRLLSDRLIQQGPAFKHPMEVFVNGSTGEVTVTYTADGKEKTEAERLQLPLNLANGLIPVLLKNVDPDASEIKLSLVVPTPKPKLVKLGIAPHGEEPFSTGGVSHKALHYIVKAEIGGLSGLFVSLLGKEPPDTHVWILQGEAPTFVKMEGPLAQGGPVWRIELVSPAWPGESKRDAKEKK